MTGVESHDERLVMARLTAQERKLLADLSKRQKDEDDQDADKEVWVKTSAGHEVRLTGAKAASYLRKHGLDDDDDDGEESGEDEEEPDEKPKRSEGYFLGKKRAA